MARFTPKVLRLLSNELTGTVLREIDALFSDNDVPLRPPQPDENDPGERRERMRRHLASLNLDNPLDHAKLLGVYGDLLQEIARRKSQYGFDADAYRDRWIQTLKAAGFEVDPWSYGVSDPTRPTTLGLTTDVLTSLTDRSAILDHLTRLGDTVETDPRLAVSTAKALIESTAKSVLTAGGLTYTKSDKVPALVNRAQQSLALSAKGVSEEVPALRQILQSLVTLAQGVTEVRNQVGVDHGAESVPTWVRPRHARLVVGAAQVWCQLMLETLADPDAPWRKKATERELHVHRSPGSNPDGGWNGARHGATSSAWLGLPLATADACARVQVSAATQLPASWPGSLSVSPDAASLTAA